MQRVPAEFSELLTPEAHHLLEPADPEPQFLLDNDLTPYARFGDMLRTDVADGTLGLLEQHWPIMREHLLEVPLSRASQSDADMDYEWAPYSARYHEMYCSLGEEPEGDKATFFADTGLLDLARSGSMKAFAERITGCELTQNHRSGILVVCYGAGGYISTHNDVSWPIDAGWDPSGKATAYIDLHLAFSTDAVEQQFLMMQEGGFLSQMAGGRPKNGTVSLYRQPFWHCSTPLVATPGREDEARRWVVMFNYEIVDDPRLKLLG